jgi:hypothetical protein
MKIEDIKWPKYEDDSMTDMLRYLQEKIDDKFKTEYLTYYSTPQASENGCALSGTRTKEFNKFPHRKPDLDLEEGDHLCEECNGWGELFIDSKYYYYQNLEQRREPKYRGMQGYNMLCPSCQGHGKLDWVSHVTGQVPPEKIDRSNRVNQDPLQLEAIAKMKKRIEMMIEEKLMLSVSPMIFSLKGDST